MNPRQDKQGPRTPGELDQRHGIGKHLKELREAKNWETTIRLGDSAVKVRFLRRGYTTILILHGSFHGSESAGEENLKIPEEFLPNAKQITGAESTAALWGKDGFLVSSAGSMSLFKQGTVKISFDFRHFTKDESFTLGGSMTWIN